MRSSWRAIRLMWSLHRAERLQGIEANSASRSFSMMCASESVEVDAYEPLGKYCGTIVVIHGMSPEGHKDPRIVMLCLALSQVGFRVVSPNVQSIQDLTINALQITMIADVLKALASCNDLTPSGKISVLAPSFSGAICLAAASMPELEGKIASICAIGTFTHVDSVINYLLTEPSADPYGMYIVLKKILPLSLMFLPDNSSLCSLQKALDAAVQDNLNGIPGTEYEKYKATMRASDNQTVERLLNDADYRRMMYQVSRQKVSEELTAFDMDTRLKSLSASVFLLHGEHDNVIPSSQSVRLNGTLKGLEKSTRLVVTPFLSHGDTEFNFKQIPDVVSVVKGFAFFFSELERAC